MIRFLGNIEVRADAKGRVFIPATFRKQLQAASEERLIMRKDCLLYTSPGIRIQISGIIGLSLYGLIAHFFRFIQITTLYCQIIGIVVQCANIGRRCV